MASVTTNYGFTKPAQSEAYDIDVYNDNMDAIDNNLKSVSDRVIINDNGGISIGDSSSATYGAAIGKNSSTGYGGAVGRSTTAGSGFAGGYNAKTSNGAAVGYNARCVDSSSGSGIDAVQLGTGTNSVEQSLQVYSYTLMNADGTIPAGRLVNAPCNVTITDVGGIIIGDGACTGSGVSIGGGTAANGVSIGYQSAAGSGAAIGYGAGSLLGGAVGYKAKVQGGGAIGDSASAESGGAVGSGATSTGGGFAGGKDAKATDAVQLGEGTNSVERSMQVYDYTLMNADGTIPAERLSDGSITSEKLSGDVTYSDYLTMSGHTDYAIPVTGSVSFTQDGDSTVSGDGLVTGFTVGVWANNLVLYYGGEEITIPDDDNFMGYFNITTDIDTLYLSYPGGVAAAVENDSVHPNAYRKIVFATYMDEESGELYLGGINDYTFTDFHTDEISSMTVYADAAVTTGKIADGAVTEEKLSDDVASLLDTRLGAQFVTALPTATFANDFSSDTGFTAANRCTAAITTDDDESYLEITTASNAGNQYAYAYYDLSSTLADNTSSAIIEFDALISEGSRAKISLVDLSKRVDSDGNTAPGTSSKDSYDKTGIAFRFGEYNDGYAMLQDTTPTCTFGSWMHFRYVIDVSTRSISYTITDRESSDVLFTGTSEFLNDEAETVTAVEMYSYVNSAEVNFDNLDVTANYDVDETTVYIVGTSEDGYNLYMYKDGEAKALTEEHEEVYSSAPVQIGTWIDGTPVWRWAFDGIEISDDDYSDGIKDLEPYIPVTSMNDIFIINSMCIASAGADYNCAIDDIKLTQDGQMYSFSLSNANAKVHETVYGYVEFVSSESNIS